jgi:uncharacterized protein
MDIICDTSFLMVLVSKPIKRIEKIQAYFGKLDFLIPDAVVSELEYLERKTGPKRATIAKAAIEIAYSKLRIIKVIKSEHVDESIIEYAVSHKCAAATIDRDLRRRLMLNGVLVLTLSKNKLVIANPKIENQF